MKNFIGCKHSKTKDVSFLFKEGVLIKRQVRLLPADLAECQASVRFPTKAADSEQTRVALLLPGHWETRTTPVSYQPGWRNVRQTDKEVFKAVSSHSCFNTWSTNSNNLFLYPATTAQETLFKIFYRTSGLSHCSLACQQQHPVVVVPGDISELRIVLRLVAEDEKILSMTPGLLLTLWSQMLAFVGPRTISVAFKLRNSSFRWYHYTLLDS